MAVDSSSSAELPTEEARREEKSLALDTTPNDSQPETEVGNGTGNSSNDVEPPAPEAKRSVTGLKVCGVSLRNSIAAIYSGPWGSPSRLI